MNLSGISDFGSTQTLASWTKKSLYCQKRQSLQLLLHVSVSGSGKKVLVCPNSWGLLLSTFLDVQRLLSPTVVAQLAPYGRPDSSSLGQLPCFSCGWIHPFTVLLPALFLELRMWMGKGTRLSQQGFWEQNQGLMSSMTMLTKTLYLFGDLLFLVDIPQQKCCLPPSVIDRNDKALIQTSNLFFWACTMEQEPFMLYPAILASRWACWSPHGSGPPQ